MNPYSFPRTPSRTRRYQLFALLCIVGVIGFLVVSSTFAWLRHANTPPTGFPLETEIEVSEGLTLQEVTELFKEQNLVRSSFMLYTALLLEAEEPVIQAGLYRFPEPLTTRTIARALISGEYQSPLVRVTFPEGFAASHLRSYYPRTYTPESTEIALNELEGYLFPDTYHITSTMPEEKLLSLMRNTFDLKISPYEEAIAESGFTQSEVIILASIIEREAKDFASKKRVSGILQNRLKEGMMLQVDATLDYLLDKTSAELTIEDLAIDSPFNIYVYKGLPPAPIANPGLDSIEAVLYPEETDYLYYLTAPDGTFYYARTFEEHKENKQRYLP